jgi:hypothetical protein
MYCGKGDNAKSDSDNGKSDKAHAERSSSWEELLIVTMDDVTESDTEVI